MTTSNDDGESYVVVLQNPYHRSSDWSNLLLASRVLSVGKLYILNLMKDAFAMLMEIGRLSSILDLLCCAMWNHIQFHLIAVIAVAVVAIVLVIIM